MTNDAQRIRFLKLLPVFCTIAVFCVILGYFITPQLLISLGPMQQSLTSDIESVRKIAYFEVALLKVFFYIFAVLLIVVVISWKRVINSSFVRLINAHTLLESDRHSTFNLSFLIMICCLAVGVFYMRAGAYVFTPIQLNMINIENGIIENLSVLFLIIAFLFSVTLLSKLRGQRARFVTHGIMAFLFFFMAGEEMSWGQHLFDLADPVILNGINVQGEINFHNMFGYFAVHFFIAGIFIYGFVLSFFAHFSVFCRKFFDFFGIPIASLGLAIGFFMVSMLQSWIAGALIALQTGFRIEELRELLTAIALSVLMWESWLLLNRKKKGMESSSKI